MSDQRSRSLWALRNPAKSMTLTGRAICRPHCSHFRLDFIVFISVFASLKVYAHAHGDSDKPRTNASAADKLILTTFFSLPTPTIVPVSFGNLNSVGMV